MAKPQRFLSWGFRQHEDYRLTPPKPPPGFDIERGGASPRPPVHKSDDAQRAEPGTITSIGVSPDRARPPVVTSDRGRRTFGSDAGGVADVRHRMILHGQLDASGRLSADPAIGDGRD
jgi:hypothetical protein